MMVYVVITPESPGGHVLSVWSTREKALASQRHYDETFGLWRQGVCVAAGAYIREYEIDGSRM